MTQNRCTTSRIGTLEIGNQKPAIRVRLRAPLVAVLMPQCHLDLLDGLGALGTGFPFPEQHETLTAHTAMRFSIPIRTLAEHLHTLLASW
jgi:hypothetical protein